MRDLIFKVKNKKEYIRLISIDPLTGLVKVEVADNVDFDLLSLKQSQEIKLNNLIFDIQSSNLLLVSSVGKALIYITKPDGTYQKVEMTTK